MLVCLFLFCHRVSLSSPWILVLVHLVAVTSLITHYLLLCSSSQLHASKHSYLPWTGIRPIGPRPSYHQNILLPYQRDLPITINLGDIDRNTYVRTKHCLQAKVCFGRVRSESCVGCHISPHNCPKELLFRQTTLLPSRRNELAAPLS